MRLFRSVRELKAEYDCGITTIARHSDTVWRVMFVRQAAESVTLRKTSEGIARRRNHSDRIIATRGSPRLWNVEWFVAPTGTSRASPTRACLISAHPKRSPAPNATSALLLHKQPNMWPTAHKSIGSADREHHDTSARPASRIGVNASASFSCHPLVAIWRVREIRGGTCGLVTVPACQPFMGLVRNTRRNLPIWISSPLASTADCTG